MIQHLSAGKLSVPKLLIFLSTHQLSDVARIEELDYLELRRNCCLVIYGRGETQLCPSQDSTNKCGYTSFRWLTGQGRWTQIGWVKLPKNVGP